LKDAREQLDQRIVTTDEQHVCSPCSVPVSVLQYDATHHDV
jgi:hypothetical protein